MMKKLLFLAALMIGTASFAQFANIGLLGGSTVTGWTSDTDMATTDGVIYTLNNVVITVPEMDGGVKFRQDDAWVTNWGAATFPAGTGTQGGANIPAVNGTYNVTFNLTTKAYNFENVVGFNEVMITGAGVSFTMSTIDGINYSADNIEFPESDITFVLNGTAIVGSTSFPSGTLGEGGAIPVPANAYNVDFNTQTGAYMFNFVTVSLIGEGVVNWSTDTDLATTDGINYTLSNFTFPGGGAKFRQNHDYTPGWGATEFPSGTGSTAGDAPNIPVMAGTYDVTFNRTSGAYSFDTVAGIKDFAAGSVTVYPNPSQNNWNFTAKGPINTIRVMDVTGKLIMAKNFASNEAAIDASGLTAGVYFAKIDLGNAIQVIKVVKK